MARTCKKGIDYFSHDTSMSNDFKIKMIQAKHGIIAYAIYNKLLEKLYDENGYWLHLSEDVNILFCNDNIITIDVYILALNECINYKLFNSKLYEKYGILTSERIQQNYCEAVKRRKQVDFINEYLLLEKDSVHMKDLNVNIISLNADINPLNDDIGTQKKREETKEKGKENEKQFETFWNLYPRKINKKKSKQIFLSLSKKSDFDLSFVMSQLKKQTEQQGWIKENGKWVPHPTTWLNNEKWNDEVEDNGAPQPEWMREL